MIISAFVMVLGIAAAVYFAIGDYTEGLLLVIVILPAALLFVQATQG